MYLLNLIRSLLSRKTIKVQPLPKIPGNEVRPKPEVPTQPSPDISNGPIPKISANLGWEADHPERKAWSEYLFNQFYTTDLYDLMMRAKDVLDIRQDIATMNKAQRCAVFSEFICQMAKWESSWREDVKVPGTTGSSDYNTYACGLLQMGVIDQKGFNTGTNYTWQELCTAIPNLHCGLGILRNQLKKENEIFLDKYPSVLDDKDRNVFWAVILQGGKTNRTPDILSHVRALKV